MHTSRQPLLLPKMEQFRSWSSARLSGPAPLLPPRTFHATLWNDSMVNTPTFTLFLNLLFTALLLEKPSPLFLLKFSQWSLLPFSHSAYLRAGRSVHFQTVNLKCPCKNICAVQHLERLPKISPHYYAVTSCLLFIQCRLEHLPLLSPMLSLTSCWENTVETITFSHLPILGFQFCSSHFLWHPNAGYSCFLGGLHSRMMKSHHLTLQLAQHQPQLNLFTQSLFTFFLLTSLLSLLPSPG